MDFEKENEIRFSIFVNIKHKEEDMGSMHVERLKAENQLFFVWVIDRNNDLK
ncbi:MAG: hypothetical protein IPL31_12920 [Saprospiraceae bacterium]|nr:hypothetical protein [Saprospiraceae bacterium]